MTRVRGAAAGAAGLLLAGILACGERPGSDAAGGEASTARPPLAAQTDTARTAPPPAASARISPELVVRAFARVRDDTVKTGLVVTNTSPDTVPVDHGACALAVRVYRTGPVGARPAWRSDDPDAEIVCPAIALRIELGGHQEYAPEELRTAIPMDRILGDSLPDGAYQIVVVSDLGPRPVELLAGVAPLRRSSGPPRVP